MATTKKKSTKAETVNTDETLKNPEVSEAVEINDDVVDAKVGEQVETDVAVPAEPNTEPEAQNGDAPVADTAVEQQEQTEEKKSDDYRHRIRYDYDTGFVLLRVSSNTDPRKLGGAISKHFRDGARALVVSYIGVNALSIAIKGVCAAQEYLPKENIDRIKGKKLAIVPEYHEFTNENGSVNTQKFTLYLVDELKA